MQVCNSVFIWFSRRFLQCPLERLASAWTEEDRGQREDFFLHFLHLKKINTKKRIRRRQEARIVARGVGWEGLGFPDPTVHLRTIPMEVWMYIYLVTEVISWGCVGGPFGVSHPRRYKTCYFNIEKDIIQARGTRVDYHGPRDWVSTGRGNTGSESQVNLNPNFLFLPSTSTYHTNNTIQSILVCQSASKQKHSQTWIPLDPVQWVWKTRKLTRK